MGTFFNFISRRVSGKFITSQDFCLLLFKRRSVEHIMNFSDELIDERKKIESNGS